MPPPSSAALLSQLREALPAPARGADAAALLPEPTHDRAFRRRAWTERLARHYGPGAMPAPRKRRRASRWLLLALLFGASAAIVYWPQVSAVYFDAYPGDAKKREALRACSAENPAFVRFLPDERDACYERMEHRLAGAQTATVAPTPE